MTLRLIKRGGCQACASAGCLECKGGGRAGVYGGSPSPPTCLDCAPTTLLYYNASITIPEGGQPAPAYITDTRNEPVVTTPDDWEISVVRFDVSANEIPSMVLPMPGPPAVGLVPTNLVVTLVIPPTSYQATVFINNPVLQEYGFLFHIDQLINAINVAFAAAFALMPGGTAVAPPALVWDPKTQLVSLYYGVEYTTTVQVWVDSSTYKYIFSMPAIFNGFNNPSGLDYQLQTVTSSAIQIPPTGARAGYPVVVQAMNTDTRYISQAGVIVSSMNGVRSIFITTSMPINSEGLPFSPMLNQNVGTSSNSMPILSDFLLSAANTSNPDSDRVEVEYLPTAEYRMVQMRGKSALTRIDLKFWFALFDGRIFELFLPPGGFASVKLLFRKRGAAY